MADRAVGSVLIGGCGIGLMARNALALAVKLLDQLQHGSLMGQRDMPLRQTGVVGMQLQIARTTVVLQTQGLVDSQSPLLPMVS